MSPIPDTRYPIPSVAYWQDGLWSRPDRVRYPGLAGPAQADVVIIGGGISGCSLAYWLARDGVRPLLLEARTIAAGASGRNAGFLTASTAEGYATVVDRFGRETARRLWAFSAANSASVRGVIEEHGLHDIGYQLIDAVTLAASAEEAAAVERHVRLLQADGWPVERLQREDLPPLLRRHYLGGVLKRANAEIDPARFVDALASLAASLGARIHEHSEVTGWSETAAGGVRLETASGDVQAQTAILATNALAPRLAPELPITAQRGQVLATQPLPERYCNWLCGANWGHQYRHQLPDNRLVVGGWRNLAVGEEERDAIVERPTEMVQAGIDAFLRDVYGLTDPLPVTHRWA
ncbi:MAG: NAD(P)/FAD-dependent oxidoreductase, partial [Dehalococcoidia bacterium]